MKSLWSDEEARQYEDELGLRVYTSRLLGRDPALVLHGGGNTSVKLIEKNLLGEEETLLYVKGSGWDLEAIDRPGFPAVKLNHLIKLAELDQLSDPMMVNELRTNMTLASAPTPSVEAILHATLPYKYVDHTHADAIVTITNTGDGKRRIQEIYGDEVVIIDYIMPGFDLAKLCAQEFKKQAHDKTIGMVLLNHGIFSFADDAKTSYERMIYLVDKAEQYLQNNNAWDVVPELAITQQPLNIAERAKLRKAISDTAGNPMIVQARQSEKFNAFSQREDLVQIAQQGPATPDHVIRTKRLPMLGTDVAQYVAAYKEYFETCSKSAREEKTMLDPAPRLLIDGACGVLSIGRSAKDANIVADIYEHTIDVILRAEALGGYQALSQQDIFDMEYWDLEQAKLKKAGSVPEFSGEIALVTGGGSGIGLACVDALLAKGAAVVSLDLREDIAELRQSPAYLGIQCDVSQPAQISRALQQCVQTFGGLDILVLNAGIFPGGKAIADMDDDLWRKVMAVNLDANLALLRECHALLKEAPKGGRVAVIGSKNVPAPGPGAAAYSASKAALNQLARIAALEWGKDHIRINTLHPDAVFDTGIWTPEVLEARAKHYGMSVQAYKTKNILGEEICSADVAALVMSICGASFAKTTGAQIPIDGGNDRVI
ncbi:MAG: bifunctional aldolase/short-chain dehydrogenase [Gammaproteobacteria bacterium]|nr:bifunctional aldolase/short-chain dehydrogenase [Gammaproteobacteria bacterium]